MATSIYASQIDALTSTAVLPNLNRNKMLCHRFVLLWSILPGKEKKKSLEWNVTPIQFVTKVWFDRPETYALL